MSEPTLIYINTRKFNPVHFFYYLDEKKCNKFEII